jgi:replication factor C subunit 1
MDEVDGMDGNADRGGISVSTKGKFLRGSVSVIIKAIDNVDWLTLQELISLIKSSSIPVLCICNDRQKRSIRNLAGHCYDLPFQRPTVKQICAAVKTVCFNEHIKMEPQVLNEIVLASGQDMRQVRVV